MVRAATNAASLLRWICLRLALLLVAVVCFPSFDAPPLSASLLPCVRHAAALLPSHDIILRRAGTTYKYTMYSGAAVTGESLFTGDTTYPYVYSADMNGVVVAMLNGFLTQSNESISAAGGGFATCIDGNPANADGTTCFKSLLSAAYPSDCPAANKLCCPLFWRKSGQDVRTPMWQVMPQTIFWNGAAAINGYFANFTPSYLEANNNCSQPLFSSAGSISVATDVYGEWRLVNVVTTYTLLETALSTNASGSAAFFGENPQEAITNVVKSQQPIFNPVTVPIAVAIDAALLALVLVFLIIAAPCGICRPAKRVRQYQQRTIELVAQQRKKHAADILNDLSSAEESCSSSRSSSRADTHSRGPPASTRAGGAGASKKNSNVGSQRNGAGEAEGTNQMKNGSAASKKSSFKKIDAEQLPPAAPSSHQLPGVQRRSGEQQAPSRRAPVGSTSTMAHNVAQQQRQQQQQQQQLPEPQENNWIAF